MICMPCISFNGIMDKLLKPVDSPQGVQKTVEIKMTSKSFNIRILNVPINIRRDWLSLLKTYMLFLLATFGATFSMYSCRLANDKGLICSTSL